MGFQSLHFGSFLLGYAAAGDATGAGTTTAAPDPNAGQATGQGQQAPGGGLGSMLFFIAPLLVLFYFMVMLPEKRRRAQADKMLDELKKNDRIETIGGIRGTVYNVIKEANEVVILVDESNNTKLRMSRSAVSRKVDAEDGKAKELPATGEKK